MSSEDIATEISQQEAEIAAPVAAQEKMVPQSEVDKIVHARIMRERANIAPQMQAPSFDEEALIAKATERMQKQLEEQREAYEQEQQKAQVDKIAETYLEKMALGKELYDDFEDVTADFSPAAYPQVTIMASQYDNLPDIMYELGKNPRKLVDLHVLALTNPPQAKKEMQKLSASIKDNQTALATNVKSPSPLNKLKSSAAAGRDTGKRTIRDLRADPRFRG